MKYLIANFLPWFSLLSRGKIGAGLLCLFLQITVIGWLPAIIWAFASTHKSDSDKRINGILKAIKER